MDRMLSLVVIAAIALGLAALVAAHGTLRRVVIREHQTGLLFRRGHLARTLDAGAYWIGRPALRLVVVDTRPRIVSTAGQEVPVKDGTPIRATLAIRYRVADPAAALAGAASWEESLYLDAQLALRDLAATLDVDELVERRGRLGVDLTAAVAARAAALGLEIEAVHVKDLTFPAPIKDAFARVVEARKGAVVAMERARGETAAMRHLANAARAFEGNPGLAMLRTLQALDHGRNTVVLGHPTALFPTAPPSPGPPGPPPADR
jgi:regulator of protease activity HflC (stomatin/prohibitin superfamily)